MSVINRTLFYTRVKDKIAFHEWTMVNTSLGVMIEPLNLQNRFNADGTAFDLTDEASLITEMKEVDFNQLARYFPFSDGETRLHSGSGNINSGI